MNKDNNKYMFGICKVNDKGQIVIPNEARKLFDIKSGDMLLVLGDKKKGGLALVKTEVINDAVDDILGGND